MNEGKKRDYSEAYEKFYGEYKKFTNATMDIAKSATEISGEKVDEKIILKNFKKQVIPFAGLMRSWSRGRESNPHIDESVDESGILYRAGVKKYGNRLCKTRQFS